MAYLIAIGVTFILLLAFLALSALETTHGFRVLKGARQALDRQAARGYFIATHIDWGAFTVHVARTTAVRVAHDVVHATLIAVRATERTLTRLIRNLRERVARTTPAAIPVEGSQLIATIVRFRKNLTRDPEDSTSK